MTFFQMRVKIHAAKVTCTSAIRTARNVVNDFGAEQASSVGGLTSLAKINLGNSERDSHQLLSNKLGLGLPIPLHNLAGGKGSEIQMIRLHEWAKLLLRTNSWHLLCGLVRPNPERETAIWASFWARYQKLDPGHEIFALAEAGQVELARCAAVLLHGDEGQGRRRQAVLALSFYSILGRGSKAALEREKNEGVKKHWLKQKTNFLGHTYTTRFLSGILPKALYSEKDATFHSLLEAIYEEANFMSRVGVKDHGQNVYRMVLLRTVGDSPFLHKSGGLQRTYANVVKRPNQVAGGICHLCQAGEDQFPFEEIATRRPAWASTRLTQSPFKAQPPAACVPHTEGALARHFAYDLFHTWHLGMAKNFLGSVLALLSNLEAGNIDERFHQLTLKYRRWCRETSHASVVTKITKDTIQWPSTKDYPTGGWFKADLSTTLMEWFESLDGSLNIEAEPLLGIAMEAAKAINDFLRFLYQS